MSGANVEDFISYWEAEGAAYAKQGDYAWMASQVSGQRILEIGCGLGFGTQALAARGLSVLAMDLLEPCLKVARERLGATEQLTFLQADLDTLDEAALQAIADFKPDTAVCWLMGAPQDVTHAPGQEARQAVAAYREKMHRKMAELAASLPEVQTVHLVDRTVIPWQAKDIGRDTLVQYHLAKTFLDLPFDAVRKDALYRKLEGGAELAELRRTHPALKSVVPTLASLLLHRRKNPQES